VQPATVRLFRLDRSERVLLPVFGSGHPLDVLGPLEGLLESPEPAVFDDERPTPKALAPAALSIRLAVAGEPVGLLALSARSDERPYEGGDVAFVSSLAGPLAAALVNTRAYEEIEALNQELEARVIARTRELEDKNAELALLNERKDELVATVSHDFRSPLAIIRQNVQTMLRDLGQMEAADLRYFLEAVSRQEGRLASMCENLLDLARLKQTRAPSDDVHMGRLVASLVEGFRPRADDAGVALEVTVEEGAPLVVKGDADRLGQVLQNLVDNAIKFTPPRGQVRVRLGADEGRLILCVEDSGCGVPASALHRLFEPFFQVPRASHAGQGSGLGLAIAKAVVDAHGGVIEVFSEEGAGTRFVLSLGAAPLDASLVFA